MMHLNRRGVSRCSAGRTQSVSAHRVVPTGQHNAVLRSPCHLLKDQVANCSGAPAFGRAAPRTGGKRFAVATAATASDAGIQVSKTELTSTTRRVSVTIPTSMCQEGFHTTVENLKKIVGNLRGFRNDKIPLSMLVTQCGGQANFKRTMIEEILTSTLPKALNKVGEPVVPDSTKIISDIKAMEAVFDPAKPFAYEVEYETVPLKWIKPYKGLEVTIRDNGNFSTDSRSVDALIRSSLKQRGFQRVVMGRGMQVGDTCVMDLTVCQKGSSTPLTGMRKDKFPMDTEVDPIGIVQGVVGMKAGEERQFPIRIPSDYVVELWQGMEAEVKVKVHEVFAWVLPEFDDEFVKTYYGADFASAEDMRKGLMTSAAMDRVRALDSQLEDKLVEAVVSCLEVPKVPDSLVNEMGSTQYRNTLMSMLQTNVATKDELEAMLTEEAIDEYIAKNRDDLEDLVIFNLAVDLIFKAEGLALDEADVQAEMETQKQTYKVQNLEYDPQMLRDQVEDSFRSVKVIEWLKDNVKRNVLPYES